MSFSLDGVVPWGRSYAEYRAMFALDAAGFNPRRILACADGPASFNAEATERGLQVISCDPLYGLDRDTIQSQIEASYTDVVDGMRHNQDDFNWSLLHPSPDAVGQLRMAAMRSFLYDFASGHEQGRYVNSSLPVLPFSDREFDLALCSHFLFLYSEQFSTDFHVQSIREMLRVAGEVRIFPVFALGGKLSPHVMPVSEALQADGYVVKQQAVDYEFVKGANQMFVVTRSQ